MIILLFISFLIIFYGCLILGEWLTKRSRFISSLGEKIYLNKIKQLETSKLFSTLRSAMENQLLFKALFFIFPLIVLKSIAFYFIALFLITPIVIAFQGIAMGSLFIYHRNNIGSINQLKTITFWQLTSHIIAASFGTSLGLKWLYFEEIDFNLKTIFTNEALLCFILLAMTALIAAYLEAKSIIIKKEI